MKFMESKEYDVIIIRRTTNCQNEDSVFSSTPTPSTGRPFPRKPMLHHTKENMQILLTIKFNFVFLPIEYWLVSTIDPQEQDLHRHRPEELLQFGGVCRQGTRPADDQPCRGRCEPDGEDHLLSGVALSEGLWGGRPAPTFRGGKEDERGEL